MDFRGAKIATHKNYMLCIIPICSPNSKLQIERE